MCAITKRLVTGHPAPAQRDGWFVGVQGECVPVLVCYYNRTFDDEGTVLAAANRHIGHRVQLSWKKIGWVNGIWLE